MSDTISRQAAIDALDCINGVEEVLRSLPSAQSEPCEDAVSRAAVIDLIEASDLDLADRTDNQAVCSFVKMMPSVTPKRKEGKWIDQKGGGCCCSECGRYALDEVDGNFIHVAAKSNFCPNCGAEM